MSRQSTSAPSVKQCVDCGEPFHRRDQTSKQWGAEKRCARCFTEHLKAKLLKTCAVTDGCWEWTGYKRNGYGTISVHGSHAYAHRLAYELFVGPVQDGLFVCHRCDNKACIRHDHLFLGTRQDNLQDMFSKGRNSPPPKITGEAHHTVTLTDEQVAELRSLHRSGKHKQRDLAERFGVSQSTVWRIGHGHTRKAAGA